jgi:hypothetical protein
MISPDLRQLAFEGAPTGSMYGFDIEPGFFNIGHDFYKDRETFEATFVEADGFAELDTTALGQYKGKFDIIWCPKFIHLWDRPNQNKLAARLVQLLKPQPGSMFLGSQNGLPEPQDLIMTQRLNETPTKFFGNADTVKEDWQEVAKLTGMSWDVKARLLDLRDLGLHKDDGSTYKRITGYNLQWTAAIV